MSLLDSCGLLSKRKVVLICYVKPRAWFRHRHCQTVNLKFVHAKIDPKWDKCLNLVRSFGYLLRLLSFQAVRFYSTALKRFTDIIDLNFLPNEMQLFNPFI